MPRANRYFTKGRHYHVTHRCHNRSFLLKFTKDRDLYRSMLMERLGAFRVSLLGYCLTSNHVHLMLTAPDQERIGKLMQSLAGDFAQKYNIRKQRSGAFWGDRYHATLIEGGRYLWNCLRYIDLNMVRTGVVAHPEQWKWCGYDELVGRRRRYRLLDQEAVIGGLGDGMTVNGFRTNYEADLEEAIRQQNHRREAMWTESLAVGSERFVRSVESTLKNRRESEVLEAMEKNGTWVLKESRLEYA